MGVQRPTSYIVQHPIRALLMSQLGIPQICGRLSGCALQIGKLHKAAFLISPLLCPSPWDHTY